MRIQFVHLPNKPIRDYKRLDFFTISCYTVLENAKEGQAMTIRRTKPKPKAKTRGKAKDYNAFWSTNGTTMDEITLRGASSREPKSRPTPSLAKLRFMGEKP